MHDTAQLFSPAAYIHDSEENQMQIEKLISESNIGGLTFFHSRHSAAANFEKRQETLHYENTLEKLIGLINRFQKISEIPLLISIDAEFGLAMRVENTPQYPYAITLAELPLEEVSLVEEVGYRIGRDLKACGIHINFAPVVDVNTNPKNPVIGYRAFGDDVTKVSIFSKAYYNGIQKAGIIGCYKHFPGHGDTDVDSHLGLPIINKTKSELLKGELLPFVNGINNSIGMVMVGHLAVPSLTNEQLIPASISKDIITGLLKHELQFEGLVVSDALNMKSVASLYPEKGKLEWMAFEAGNDILCFSENTIEGIAYIEKHSSAAKITGAVSKIASLKNKLGISKNPLNTPTFDWSSHSKFLQKLSKLYIKTVYSNHNKTLNFNDYSRWAKVSLHAQRHDSFDNKISQINDRYALEELEGENDLGKYEVLLFSLFVPSAKPINNFGLDSKLIEKMENLAQNKSCILYFFGHRYALDMLLNKESFARIVIAHQAFAETQIEAANHFNALFE